MCLSLKEHLDELRVKEIVDKAVDMKIKFVSEIYICRGINMESFTVETFIINNRANAVIDMKVSTVEDSILITLQISTSLANLIFISTALSTISLTFLDILGCRYLYDAPLPFTPSGWLQHAGEIRKCRDPFHEDLQLINQDAVEGRTNMEEL
ncbi:hypothetical protein L1887_39345 [Cichorium endivia]|nr:hypothetical protein L1887_39345 [Cichorium endivia]